MPTDSPVMQSDFEQVVAPIIALLKFYSARPVELVRIGMPQSYGGDRPQVRLELEYNFLLHETPLDPYIFVLLKANNRGRAITFSVEHDLAPHLRRVQPWSELVVTGSSNLPRTSYVIEVEQLIRNFGRARALNNHERTLMRYAAVVSQFSDL